MTYTGTGPQHLLGETIKMSAISGFAPLWSPGSAWSHIRLDALEVQWCCRFPINGPEESQPGGRLPFVQQKKVDWHGCSSNQGPGKFNENVQVQTWWLSVHRLLQGARPSGSPCTGLQPSHTGVKIIWYQLQGIVCQQGCPSSKSKGCRLRSRSWPRLFAS